MLKLWFIIYLVLKAFVIFCSYLGYMCCACNHQHFHNPFGLVSDITNLIYCIHFVNYENVNSWFFWRWFVTTWFNSVLPSH